MTNLKKQRGGQPGNPGNKRPSRSFATLPPATRRQIAQHGNRMLRHYELEHRFTSETARAAAQRPRRKRRGAQGEAADGRHQ